VQFIGEPILLIETGRFVGVNLDTQFIWSAEVKQLGKKAARRLGLLDLFFNTKRFLSVRKSVLIYKQPVCSMMD
jgi:hypothetical protein